MTEQTTGTQDNEIILAQELLDNPRIAWHSVNGFELGAVVGILEKGIEPYAQFGGRLAISLASSPSDPTLTEHPTYNYYVPKSISFPVALQGERVSRQDSHDELQTEDLIPRNHIYGIMIPEKFANRVLTDLPILKPPARSRVNAYIDRQTSALRKLKPGGIDREVESELEKLVEAYKSAYDNYEARKQAAYNLNYFVMAQYEACLGSLIGVDQPNLIQSINYISQLYDTQVLVLANKGDR
jgi:hypothetical protein